MKSMYGYIYLTTNTITGKVYIGQHCASSFDDSYKGSGIKFKKALKKYGKENFKVSLLEAVYSGQEELNEKERYYIKLYNSTHKDVGYNLDNGGSGIGTHSESTKEKIRLSSKGKIVTYETRQKQSLSMKKRLENLDTLKEVCSHLKGGMLGKHQSEETKNKISAANKNNNYVMSEETKQKIINAHKGVSPSNCRKVMCIETGQVFDSVTSAAQFCKLKSVSSIVNSLKKYYTDDATSGGFHWRYVEVNTNEEY